MPTQWFDNQYHCKQTFRHCSEVVYGLSFEIKLLKRCWLCIFSNDLYFVVHVLSEMFLMQLNYDEKAIRQRACLKLKFFWGDFQVNLWKNGLYIIINMADYLLFLFFMLYRTVEHDLSRFKSPEGFFNADLWEMDYPTLQKLIHRAIQTCPMDNRRHMWR